MFEQIKATISMKLLVVISFLFESFFLLAQNQIEYVTHLKSIENTWYPLRGNEDAFHTTNANLALVQTIIANYLEYPEQYKYIADRRLLRKLKGFYNNLEIEFRDTTSTGEEFYLRMNFAKFDTATHQITLTDNGYCCKLIDGKYPYGSEYILPSFQVDTLYAIIGNVNTSIPFNAYSNLYNIVRIPEDDFERRVELYESLNDEYYYLYFYGGSAASTYFGKLILSKGSYHGRIIVDYETLSETNSARKNFIGF